MKSTSDVEEESPNLNLSSVIRLFATAFAIVTITTLAIQYFRQGHQASSEIWDDCIYIFSLFSGLYLALKIIRKNGAIKWSNWISPIGALVGIGLGIWGIWLALGIFSLRMCSILIIQVARILAPSLPKVLDKKENLMNVMVSSGVMLCPVNVVFWAKECLLQYTSSLSFSV